MTKLKLMQIGNSVGLILPKQILARLKLETGDTLFVTDCANGITLSPLSHDFEGQMAQARKVLRKRRDALRELAR